MGVRVDARKWLASVLCMLVFTDDAACGFPASQTNLSSHRVLCFQKEKVFSSFNIT